MHLTSAGNNVADVRNQYFDKTIRLRVKLLLEPFFHTTHTTHMTFAETHIALIWV